MSFDVSVFLDAFRLFFRRIWPGANSLFSGSPFLFHLIRDHLQTGDEVPVDHCALLALVFEEPFSVMSHIVPFAVLLTLKSSF